MGGPGGQGTRNKEADFTPIKECYKPLLSNSHETRAPNVILKCGHVSKIKEKETVEINIRNIFCLTQYMQNIIISMCGTSHVASAQWPHEAGGCHTPWHVRDGAAGC